MPDQNIVTPFIVEDLDIRGRIAKLNSTIDNIIWRHNYPEAVSHLVAQITALAALLGSNLKNHERFSIQIRSTGAIKLLICDFTAPNGVRSYAKFNEEELKSKNLLGQGTITFIINEPSSTPLYQAIVALEGDSIAEIAERYYEQSEQIPTKIKLFSGLFVDNKSKKREYRAGGFLIQNLPHNASAGYVSYNNSYNKENWTEAKVLAQTISEDELLHVENISANTLLFRLFHQYSVRVFEPIEILDVCSCSKERIEEVIKSFNDEEIASCSENGKIKVTCQFCSKNYNIDPTKLG